MHKEKTGKERRSHNKQYYQSIVDKFKEEPEVSRQGLLIIKHIGLGTLNSWNNKPSSQHFEELLLQIKDGTSTIQTTETGIVRKVAITVLSVLDSTGQYRLVEDRQEYSENTIRDRDESDIAIRMQPGESSSHAALRALSKIGITVEESKINGTYNVPRLEERDSGSFPGLKAIYIVHDPYIKLELDASQHKEKYVVSDERKKRITTYKWVENYGSTASLDLERAAVITGGDVVQNRESGRRELQIRGDNGEKITIHKSGSFIEARMGFTVRRVNPSQNILNITNHDNSLNISTEPVSGEPAIEIVTLNYSFRRKKRL